MCIALYRTVIRSATNSSQNETKRKDMNFGYCEIYNRRTPPVTKYTLYRTQTHMRRIFFICGRPFERVFASVFYFHRYYIVDVVVLLRPYFPLPVYTMYSFWCIASFLKSCPSLIHTHSTSCQHFDHHKNSAEK